MRPVCTAVCELTCLSVLISQSVAQAVIHILVGNSLHGDALQSLIHGHIRVRLKQICVTSGAAIHGDVQGRRRGELGMYDFHWMILQIVMLCAALGCCVLLSVRMCQIECRSGGCVMLCAAAVCRTALYRCAPHCQCGCTAVLLRCMQPCAAVCPAAVCFTALHCCTSMLQTGENLWHHSTL